MHCFTAGRGDSRAKIWGALSACVLGGWQLNTLGLGSWKTGSGLDLLDTHWVLDAGAHFFYGSPNPVKQ